MKSVYKLLDENRAEAIKFLEGQPNNQFTFIKEAEDSNDYDVEWVNPNDGDNPCYPEDVAPVVTYANDDGNIYEYIVTDIFLDYDKMLLSKPNDRLVLEVSLVCATDYSERLKIPVAWLYGASECYIYEMLMDVVELMGVINAFGG